MKNIITIVMFLFISSLAFGQNNQADTTKKKDPKNTVIPQQVHITPGASGVKRSIGYRFSSSTEVGDPGNGVFRYDKGAAAEVKFLIVDDIDIAGEDQTKWYSTWDKTTGATGRGGITVTDSKGKVLAVFNFTAVFIDASGFWKLPVEYVSGTLPGDGSVCYYVFERIAHNKPSDANDQGNQPVVTPVVTAEVVAVTQTTNQVQVAVVEPPVQVQTVIVAPPVQVQTVVAEPPVQVQAAVVAPPVQVQTVVTEPPVQIQVAVTEPPVQIKDTAKVIPSTQVSQTVAVAVVATEVSAVTQTNNQVQAAVVEPPVQVQAAVVEPPVQVQVAVTEPPVQVKDTAKVIPATQVSQAAVTTTAVVTAGAIAVTQAANPPAVAQGNVSVSTQTAQSKPVTQTAPPAQTKPVTQTAPPAQSKPVTQTAPTAQTKPVTQTAPPVQTKPATQAAATTVAVQPAQKTQPTQPTQTTQPVQQIQSNQAAQPNNQAPSKQYNQFPVVQNIFASGGSGSGHRRWYRGIIEVGYGFGLGDYGINNFRFNFINAIRIGDFSSIGLGIGYRRYFTGNDAAPYLVSNVDQIPFFLDLRTSFSTRRLTPYAALGIGASRGYRSASTDKGLLMFNASGGIWYNVSSRFAVFAGIAYEMQKLQYSDTDPFADSYIKSAGSLSLNIGISF